MTALRLLFSSDVFLPRGYALGWEPLLLIADAASQLLLAAGALGLVVRAARRALLRPHALAVFASLVGALALVELVGLWWACPGLSSLLRAAAGAAALVAARRPRS